MTIYEVVKDGPDCPEVFFRTANKEKADLFADRYNKYNVFNDEDPKVVIMKYDTDNIEEHADSILSVYKIMKVIRVSSFHGNLEILSTQIKYCPYPESILQQVHGSIGHGLYIVTLYNPISDPDPDIVQCVEELIQEYIAIAAVE